MNTHFLYFDLSSGGVTGKNPIYIYRTCGSEI